MTGQVLTLDEALQDTTLALLSLLDAAGGQSVSRSTAAAPPGTSPRSSVCSLRESQVQPLLLVFEDLHWIDSETQALLDSLLDSLPTARPGQLPSGVSARLG